MVVLSAKIGLTLRIAIREARLEGVECPTDLPERRLSVSHAILSVVYFLQQRRSDRLLCFRHVAALRIDVDQGLERQSGRFVFSSSNSGFSFFEQKHRINFGDTLLDPTSPDGVLGFVSQRTFGINIQQSLKRKARDFESPAFN